MRRSGNSDWMYIFLSGQIWWTAAFLIIYSQIISKFHVHDTYNWELNKELFVISSGYFQLSAELNLKHFTILDSFWPQCWVGWLVENTFTFINDHYHFRLRHQNAAVCEKIFYSYLTYFIFIFFSKPILHSVLFFLFHSVFFFLGLSFCWRIMYAHPSHVPL